MFCLLRWWKAPFGVAWSLWSCSTAHKTHPLVFKRKTQFALCFPKCAALTNRTDKRQIQYMWIHKGKRKCNVHCCTFSNKRTQKIVFCFFFNVGELAALPPSSLEGRAALSLTSRRCFFRFPLFSFHFPFLCSIHPRAHPARCFLISVNKSQSDCFSDRCWAQNPWTRRLWAYRETLFQNEYEPFSVFVTIL